MASYSLNKHAVTKAQHLIDAHQYVLDSDWGESQPTAEQENAFLESHSWEEYAEWHKEIELAAHRLLQRLDDVSAK